MASLDLMLSMLRPSRRARSHAARPRAGRNIIRGQSGRAYDFEAHRLAALADLNGVGAVYIYARDLTSADAHRDDLDATAEDYSLGYVAETADMAAAARRHAEESHFAGYGFDVVLIVRIEQPVIRAEIAEDVITLQRPVLNNLLRSQQGGLRG